MSLLLRMGTRPDGLVVKIAAGFGMSDVGVVQIGDYEVSLADFLATAYYVLTNTDLEPDDQRLQFVKCVQSMNEVNGHNTGRKRLSSSVPAVIPPS